MTDEAISLVGPSKLEAWVAALMRRQAVSAQQADMVATALVEADLRGFDTHGVAQLPTYLSLLRNGTMKAAPEIRIERHGAMLTLDADRALGQVAASVALHEAADAAHHHGIAAVAISQCGHLGALGVFTRRVAEQGLIALLMQNGPPLMGMPGAQRRSMGNNPISFAAPVPGRPALVLDMSASNAAYGKVAAAAAAGKALPEGWALDQSGSPTNDAKVALAGMLLPIGGMKGMGLAMMVETLAGSLTGTRPNWGGGIFGGFLLIIRPDAFCSADEFATDMDQWLQHYVNSGEGNRYPGERAAAEAERRKRDGIPILPGVVSKLQKIGEECETPFPEFQAGRVEI